MLTTVIILINNVMFLCQVYSGRQVVNITRVILDFIKTVVIVKDTNKES